MFSSNQKNLAQTPFLDELLNQSLQTTNSNLVISHNSDYDSDQTDYDEVDVAESSKASEKSNNKVRQQHHRSIRVKELSLILKEGPGILTRQLNEVIKTMKSPNCPSVVNPNSLFGAVCKKYIDSAI